MPPTYGYAKASHKYIRDYDENKEPSYSQYWNVNNLYSLAMWQKLPVNNFDWIKETFQFNEDFIKKTVMKKVRKDNFWNLMFNTLKNHMTFTMIYHFYRDK